MEMFDINVIIYATTDGHVARRILISGDLRKRIDRKTTGHVVPVSIYLALLLLNWTSCCERVKRKFLLNIPHVH